MKRSEFLDNLLKDMPAAPPTCLSLSRFSRDLMRDKNNSVWLGGEVLDLHFDDKILHLVLFGQGLTMHVEFEPGSSLQGTNLQTEVWGEVILPGDKVAVRLKNAKAIQTLGKSSFAGGGEELMLLAPQQVEAWPFTQNFERQKEWRIFLNSMRKGLENLGLCEVFTPTLVECPGTEPSLEVFQTEFQLGQFHKKLNLPTSPEMHLKKMLVGGWTDIFEFKNCFRNNEVSDHHEPEFTMLEWYRAYADLGQITFDLQSLLNELHAGGLLKGPQPQLNIKSMQELFKQFLHFDLQPTTTAKELKTLLRSKEDSSSHLEDWNDLFHHIFLTQIEPQLANLGPLIIKDYPPSQRAYARLNLAGWTDRFEFYWRGLEIANAFHEVNDPVEQQKRFNSDLAERKRLGTSAVELDQDLLYGFRKGWPPTGGIALGLERLFMACLHLNDMESFKAFPANKRLIRWSTF